MSDISISNYTGSLYDVYDSSKTSSGSKLEHTLSDTGLSKASDEELMNACKEFEAYFTEQVFKSMQKTVEIWQSEEESQTSSQYRSYATETLLQKYAGNAAENGGLGLAQMLYEQMKRNYDV